MNSTKRSNTSIGTLSEESWLNNQPNGFGLQLVIMRAKQVTSRFGESNTPGAVVLVPWLINPGVFNYALGLGVGPKIVVKNLFEIC